MTAKNAKNASKNGKVTTTKEGVNVDAANLELAKKLQGTLNIAGEFAVYLEIDSLNEKCFLSVAGIRATLEEVEKVGSAPSLRSDYAHGMPRMFIPTATVIMVSEPITPFTAEPINPLTNNRFHKLKNPQLRLIFAIG